MSGPHKRNRLLVGISGAQGAGKSTFCQALAARLTGVAGSVQIAAGLGDQLKELGISLGSASNSNTIAAVFAAHLEREERTAGEVIILDRCVVDALAYTRSLRVNTDVELRLYESIARLSARALDLVIHLRLSPFFSETQATHETPELRREMAAEIPVVLAQLGRPTLDLEADDPTALDQAAEMVRQLAGDIGCRWA